MKNKTVNESENTQIAHLSTDFKQKTTRVEESKSLTERFPSPVAYKYNKDFSIELNDTIDLKIDEMAKTKDKLTKTPSTQTFAMKQMTTDSKNSDFVS
jgi:hypothetical protein